MDPTTAIFVLKELLAFGKALSPGADSLVNRFVDEFGAEHPELVKAGDEDAPDPPDREAIDAEVDELIDGGGV